MDKLCKKCDVLMATIKAQGDLYWLCKKCNRVDCCPPETNESY